MQSVNILGICGSPRKNKNSRFLLEFGLEAAETAVARSVKTELYSIAGKNFESCDGCHKCSDLGHCRKTDDFAELRDKWLAADAVIYSVPVYHMGVPGQLKSFIDRLGHSVQEGFNDRQLKPIGILTQGSGVASGQESVMIFLNNHAVMQGCIPVGGLWPIGYIGVGGRNSSWRPGPASKPQTMREAYLEKDEDIIEMVEATKELCKQIVLVTIILKSGGEQNREMLKKNGGFKFFLRRLRDK